MIHPPARRKWGQNFLVDRAAVERIAAAATGVESGTVVEIGPGRGTLTRALLERFPRVAAVEVDPALSRELVRQLPADRFTLVQGDVLRLPLAEIAERAGLRSGEGMVVVGNLPYNISKPVASKIIRERAVVSRAVLMFQKEVAERLTASPGSHGYGPLAVLSSRAFRIDRLFSLPPSAFRPRPKVVSTVTRWIPLERGAFPAEAEERLRLCLSASFAHRRQTVLRNLRSVLPGGESQALALLRAAGIDPRLRAEAVSPQQFQLLARSWPFEPSQISQGVEDGGARPP